MALNKNSTVYVTGFVGVVTIVCALIIASAATVLKPAQQAQIQANVAKNLLKVAGVEADPRQVNAAYDKYVRVAYVDTTNGELLKGSQLPFPEREYDNVLVSSKLAQYLVQVPSTDNVASLKNNELSRYQRVYKIVDEQQHVTKVVLPFYGSGLWSVMYGFLAVKPDGNTVDGIIYYQQGETPGLGGEVENPRFTSQFPGKLLYKLDNPQTPLLQLSKSPTDTEHQVSALSGASLTSAGVNNQLTFWFGKYGYAKFLENLRAGKVVLDEQ